jgi:hypothetical protein
MNCEKVVTYVSPETFRALEKRKERWLVPTAAFVRECVEQALRREAEADAKGLFSDSPNTKFPPVLFTPKQETR